MADHFRTDLDQFILQARQRPVLNRFGGRQRAQEVTEIVGQRIVCRQSISDSWLGNLRECLAHLV